MRYKSYFSILGLQVSIYYFGDISQVMCAILKLVSLCQITTILTQKFEMIHSGQLLFFFDFFLGKLLES